MSLDRYGHLRQKDDNHHDEAAVTVSSKNDDPRSIAALLEGRRRRSSSGGLLTKATNHGGLDKSCHPATITQSENDSTTSTRLHKSNACSLLNGPPPPAAAAHWASVANFVKIPPLKINFVHSVQ